MILTIPAGTTLDRFGEALPALSAWLTTNGVDPVSVSGLHELVIRTTSIDYTERVSGDKMSSIVIREIPEDLLGYLAARFGASYGEGDVLPMSQPLEVDTETASLDDIAQWVTALAMARAAEKAAKEQAEEARGQIMARLTATGKEYGAVGGQRIVHAKTIVSKRFETVRFRKSHPELADEFTAESESIRLEIL